MNLNELKSVLNNMDVDVENLKVNTQGWVQVPCVLAPWFHKDGVDNNPSLSIRVNCFPSVFKCFSCLESGKLWSLVDSYVVLSGRDDLKALADSIFENDRLTLSARLKNITWETPEFSTFQQEYNEDLLSDFAPATVRRESKDYLANRHIIFDVANQFELVYDRTRQRIVFPVRSQDGKLRGAVGRTLVDDEKKYWNYWNFEAAKNLGGAQFINKDFKYILVVEGFFDVLNSFSTLWRREINVVCTFKCEISKFQQNLLCGLDKSVWICYDNDDAGNRGRQKAMENLRGKVYGLKYYIPPKGIDVGAMSQEKIVEMTNALLTRKD